MIFVGQVICGGVVSRTVIVKLHTLELPARSVATQSTVLVPIGKNEPGGGAQTTTGFGSQISVALVLKNTRVPGGPAHSTVMLLEQEICGGAASTMVMVWLQKALLVHASAACHVRVTL